MLTTRANVKAYSKLDASALDPLIDRMIPAASALVQNFCGREFESASETIAYDGTGTRLIPARRYPLTVVDSVVVNGSEWPKVTQGIGYAFDRRFLIAVGQVWPAGIQNVSVTHAGGYQTVPADLEEAVIELVALWLNERTRTGVSSQALEGQSTSYITRALPDSIKTKLAPYRNFIA